MIKKVLSTIVIVCMVLLGLVACLPVENKEYPLSWTNYLDDVAYYYWRSVGNAYDSYSLSFQVDVNHSIEGVVTNFVMDVAIVQDVENKSNSAIKISIVANNSEVKEREVFYLACSNSDIYVLARDIYSDFGAIKYRFENTPIFDMVDLSLVNPLIARRDMRELLGMVATGCNVNEDKSIFTMDINLEQVMAKYGAKLSEIFKMIPQPIVNQINELFNCDIMNWSSVLSATYAKVDWEIKANRVCNIKIYDIAGVIDDSSRISNISIVNLTSTKDIDKNLVKSIGDDREGYSPTKIGTFSLEGDLILTDKSMQNAAVTYNYKINSSIDLIELAKYKNDFSMLDEDNYFHLRLSHICNGACTSYCSVALGNRLTSGKGAILDIAFSPRDFGTNNVYVSVGLKQLIGRNVLDKYAAKYAAVAALVMPEYTLITIDSASLETDAIGGNKSIIEMIVGVLSNVDIGTNKAVFDIAKIKELLGIEDSAILDEILSADTHSIDNVIMTYNVPTFGYVAEYDIARETLVIVDYKESTTKNHGNVILDWEFDDKSTINLDGVEGDVHNIYSGKELLYGANSAISPSEAGNLKGANIKYHYTNSVNGVVEAATATILDVYDIDYSVKDKYQLARLKVQIAPKWLGIIGNYIPTEMVSWNYAIIESYIKLTDIASTAITRSETTEYMLSPMVTTSSKSIIDGKIAITYTDGYIKTLTISGECDAISYINTSYYISKTGQHDVNYDYLGYKETYKVNIAEPDEMKLERSASMPTRINSKVELAYKKSFEFYKVTVWYGATKYILELAYDNYSVDGKSLGSDSTQWWGYKVDSGEQVLFFLANGRFTVDVNAYGLHESYEIEVTSNVLGQSQYKLVDNYTSLKVQYIDIERNHRFSMYNTVHGERGIDNVKLSIIVRRFSVNAAGLEISTDITGDASHYSINKVTFGGADVEIADNLLSLPATIMSNAPLRVEYSIAFKQVGRYNIAIVMGAIRATKEIEVRQMP